MAILAAVQLLGGSWAVLQCGAWIGMLEHYLQEGKLASAIEKTFDGRHPCELCKALTKARESEKKQERVASVKKIEMIHQEKAPVVFEPKRKESWKVVDAFAVQSFAEPATPPPRLA